MYKYFIKNKFIFPLPFISLLILCIFLGLNKHNTAEVVIGVNNLNSNSVIEVFKICEESQWEGGTGGVRFMIPGPNNNTNENKLMENTHKENSGTNSYTCLRDPN